METGDTFDTKLRLPEIAAASSSVTIWSSANLDSTIWFEFGNADSNELLRAKFIWIKIRLRRHCE